MSANLLLISFQMSCLTFGGLPRQHNSKESACQCIKHLCHSYSFLLSSSSPFVQFQCTGFFIFSKHSRFISVSEFLYFLFPLPSICHRQIFTQDWLLLIQVSFQMSFPQILFLITQSKDSLYNISCLLLPLKIFVIAFIII